MNGPEPDLDPVDLGTHTVTGPALAPVCEMGHPLAIFDGSHVRPQDAAKHQRPRAITSELFVRSLVEAGVIHDDVKDVHRIVIDARAGWPLMVYLERFGDERWLAAGLHMEGVQVSTKARDAAADPAVCSMGHPMDPASGGHIHDEDVIKHANPAAGRTVKPDALAEQP